MKRHTRLAAHIAAAGIGAVGLLGSTGCARKGADADGRLRLGFVNSPLAVAIYVAEARAVTSRERACFQSISLGSSGDIGLALLAGDIDAGFIETSKVRSLLRNSKLSALGGIEFAYGATLVVRKDLALRLDDLTGRTVAAQSPHCRLFHQFLADSQRLGVATNGVRFVFLPFEDMASALEAKKVDAILTQGAYALLSVAIGHKVLYQNWEVSGEDLCCPATDAQIEWVLVVRADVKAKDRAALVATLVEAAAAPSSEARVAVSARTRIPLESLKPFPPADFSPLSDKDRLALGDRIAADLAHTERGRDGVEHMHSDCGDDCEHGAGHVTH
jgi:ABC-type nitrate/sulfonate/bicarbonate transport system substrate-binding protein